MKCEICNNTDPTLFGKLHGKYYCRNCLLYKKDIIQKKVPKCVADYHLKYALTVEQEKISEEIYQHTLKGENVLVNAVTGAGKTEITYKTIKSFLNNGKRVGFAIPRKDIVIELYERLKKDFVNVKICAVYGSHHQVVDADIVIFTTHQGARYLRCFDLLIIDEVDAFPFYNNLVLQSILENSCCGPIVYLSATISKIKNASTLQLNRRFHNHDIPIPQIIITYKARKRLFECINLLINHKVILVFCPTIKISEEVSKILQKKYKDVVLINSQLKNREKIFNKIRAYQYKIIVTTTILERGITLEDAQVIVFRADHPNFTEACLIQIVGRVGRKINYEEGFVYFISPIKCLKFKRTIKRLKDVNSKV